VLPSVVTVPWTPWVTASTVSGLSGSLSLARTSIIVETSSSMVTLSLTKVGGSSTGVTVMFTVAVTKSTV